MERRDSIKFHMGMSHVGVYLPTDPLKYQIFPKFYFFIHINLPSPQRQVSNLFSVAELSLLTQLRKRNIRFHHPVDVAALFLYKGTPNPFVCSLPVYPTM